MCCELTLTHDVIKDGIYQIIRFRFSCVEHLNGISSARNGEDGSLEEVLGEFDGVKCR